MAADDDILVELDGPDVAPSTVHALPMLRVTHAYLSLVSKLADIADAPLLFKGVEIIDKCSALRTTASDVTRAALFCRQATECIAGTSEIPYRAIGATKDARDALREMPDQLHARVLVGSTYQAELVPEPLPVKLLPPWEQTEIRAVLLRAGGECPV